MPTAVVLADFRVDYTYVLPEGFSNERDVLRYLPLAIQCGGTAFHFARHGASLLNLIILGLLGSDPSGDYIREEITKTGVSCELLRTPDHPTGIVVYITAGRSSEHRVRLTLASTPSASDRIDVSHIQNKAAFIANADALIVDGYRYLSLPSALAAQHAAQLARKSDTISIFDLVPHDLPRRAIPIPLAEILANYDIVITELAGIKEILPMDASLDSEISDHDKARTVLAQLRKLYPGVRQWILRFGEGNMDEELVSRYPGDYEYRHTGYRDATDKVGYGELVTCLHVRDAINNARRFERQA